ncbi:MAG: type III pantothenate kinase, partial [Planctomycetota bacterium]|nr:type III pantothenate kinase [Planctomycetota bacterium]
AGEGFSIPVKADVDEPARVGTDRLLAALAAYRRAGGACIVVDAGTAVTVDAVDDDGTFLGGAIFPGPDLMARSLAEGTAQLPAVEIGREFVPERVIGKNTGDAIRSGIMRTLSGAVGGIAADMMHEVGTGVPVYITGGYAPPEDGERGIGEVVVPDLVLEGLVLAWREHHES